MITAKIILKNSMTLSTKMLKKILNFLNQPAIKLYKLNSKEHFLNSQIVEDSGFFIGLHTKKISNKLADYIAKNLLKIEQM